MKKLLFATALSLTILTAGHAALSLTNTDFEGGFDAAATPTGWTEISSNHAGAFYANVTDASGGTNNNLYMQGRGSGNIIQQAFSGGTADSQPSITVTMDTGWRNDPNPGVSYELVFEIYNTTDNVSLDSISYTIPDDNLGAAPDPRTMEFARAFTFSYDNTNPAWAGDTIAFRVTTNSSANSFDPTGFIDNLVVTIPEPSALLLLSIGGLTLFSRRRSQL